MSLINQMLRDLDERHAPPSDRAGLPPNVHVLPPEQRQPWRLVALIGFATAVATAWYFVVEVAEPPSPSPTPPAAVVVAPPIPPQAVKPPPAEPPVVAPEPPAVPENPPLVSTDPPSEAAAKPLEPMPSMREPATPRRTVPEARVSQREVPPAPSKGKQTSKGNQTSIEPNGAAKAAAGTTGGTARQDAVAPMAAAAPAPTPAAIDKRPRNASANEAADTEYHKAMTAVRRGAITEAIAGLYATLKLDPRHVSARQALLSLLVEQQLLDDARALLEEGLTLDPAQSGWAIALARLQLENGKLNDASDTLGRFSSHAEQNADYQAFFALLLQKQKRGKEAADRYRTALAIRPMESRWWYGLGLTLEADQKVQEAREAFLKARETGNLPAELANVIEQKLR